MKEITIKLKDDLHKRMSDYIACYGGNYTNLVKGLLKRHLDGVEQVDRWCDADVPIKGQGSSRYESQEF